MLRRGIRGRRLSAQASARRSGRGIVRRPGRVDLRQMFTAFSAVSAHESRPRGGGNPVAPAKCLALSPRAPPLVKRRAATQSRVMPTPVSSLPNLGPATEEAMRRAGIPDAETLRAMGADAAYAALLRAGERPHFIGYYVLHMALQGRPWNDCRGAEKEGFRRRFDALKAAHAAQGGIAGIEAILDEIGVIDPAGARRRTRSG